MFNKRVSYGILTIVLASSVQLLFFLKSSAAEPLNLSNNYEIAEGTNIDSDVDSLGNTFVVYERSGSIYLVKNRENEVLVGGGSSPALALDNTGSPHIAYISSGSVIYETFDGDWSNEVNVGLGTSASYVDIDTDSNGKAHIFMRTFYYAGDDYSNTDLIYASNVNGSFEYILGWNGYRDYSSSGSWGAAYYSTHPISISIDNSDNYHLLFWHTSIWRWPNGNDVGYDLQYHTNIPGASVNLGENHTIYKNSLTVDALGRAHVLYDGVKHGLLSGGVWNSSDLVSGSAPAIYASNSSVAVAYVNSGVNFSENFGEGFSAPINIDSTGTSPTVATNGMNRFVYYIKDSKIYLATDKAIYNAPVISGAEDGGLYNTSKTITWDNGLGSVNGMPAFSGEVVTADGTYQVIVTNADGKSTSISFSIDRTPPTITILPYNADLTNQDVTVSATTDEGSLNFASHTFTENGSFDFEAIDKAGNKTVNTVTVTNIDKIPPKITLSSYETTPTNKDIVVNASTDEGTLNAISYTFSENGSFTFEAIDNVGNKSQETVTITNIDRLAPVITLSDYTKNPTNLDIIIDATTDEGSLNKTSHTFTENGSFEFVATDEAGNSATKTVIIDNIDKLEPSNVSITSPSPFTFVKQTIALQAEGQDNESGIDRVEFYSDETGKISEDNLDPYTVDWNTSLVTDGSYHLYAIFYDKAGNSKTSAKVVTSVDNTVPIITINPYTTDPTNEDIIVTANSNEGGLNQSSYTFASNGSFEFIASDPAGNITKRTVTITNIDKEGPELTIAPYLLTPTNQNITVYASVVEGTLNPTSHTFTSNGEFEFVATDSLGNQTRQRVNITNIDKNAPKGSIVEIDGGNYMRSLVPLVVSGEDDGLGIDRVEFYHASVTTLIGTDYLAPYTIDWDTTKVEDGIHKIWSVIYDKAGNRTTTSEIEVNVDNTAPVITISDYSTEPTTESITVNATTNEGTLNRSSYTFTKNESFDFIAIDQAGNKTVKTITVNNIYVAQPTDQSNPTDEEGGSGSSENQIDSELSSGIEAVASDVVALVSKDNVIKDDSSVQTLTSNEESTNNEENKNSEEVLTESNPNVKGAMTESSKLGWWRWWYLLILVATGGLIYLLKKNQVK